MIIECPGCQARYQYDEQRFEAKPSKKIKCARCQQIFEAHNPAFAPNAPMPVDAHDETRARRAPQPKVEVQEESAPAAPPAATPKLPAGKRLSLAVLDGPDAGSVFRIDKPRVTIGRSGADLTLNDTEASRQHAAIEARETVYTLQDLGSTNGTKIDGEKIAGGVEIFNHSEFVVGMTTLMLIVTEDA